MLLLFKILDKCTEVTVQLEFTLNNLLRSTTSKAIFFKNEDLHLKKNELFLNMRKLSEINILKPKRFFTEISCYYYISNLP